MISSGEAAPLLRMQFENGVPTDARCLDGHFPNTPIVPGAMLLGYAADGLLEHGYDIAGVTRMKFQRPLLPETAFEIEVTPNADKASIVWRSAEATIAQARVTLRSHGG